MVGFVHASNEAAHEGPAFTAPGAWPTPGDAAAVGRYPEHAVFPNLSVSLAPIHAMETAVTLQKSDTLAGIRVLDFTHVLSGPFCTMILGDLGADVMKVERVGEGDETRNSMFRVNDFSMNFGMVNRNKRGIAIDLGAPQGREAARRLAANSDVLVENFRPGTMDKLGLGADEIRSINPRLVYCSISGFGAVGADRSRGGFDIVAQGMSGLMSVTGTRDGETVKLGVPVADLTAGIYTSMAIGMALLRRERTGEGERVDVSLMDSALSLLVWEAAQLWGAGTVPGPVGTAHRNRTPYQAFQAADAQFIVGAGNEATWQALCRALQRHDLADDPRFARNPDRMRHERELVMTLSEIFATKPVAHWLQVLNEHGCPAAPILDVSEAFNADHTRSRDMRLEMDNPEGGVINTIGFPYKLAAAPPRIHRRPPRLGEHTRAILEEVGQYTPAEVDALIAAGIVSTDPA